MLQRCRRNRHTDTSRVPSNLFLLLKQENSFRSSYSAPIGMNQKQALAVSVARNSLNPIFRQKSPNPFPISTSSALRLNSSFRRPKVWEIAFSAYLFCYPKGKKILYKEGKVVQGRGTCVPGRGTLVPGRGTQIPRPGTTKSIWN